MKLVNILFFLCCSFTFWDFVWINKTTSTFANENYGVMRLNILGLGHPKLSAANQ